MKKNIYLIMIAAVLAACGREDIISKDDVTVYFQIGSQPTKGLAVDADCISDCCVMVYDAGGNLVVSEYCPDGPLTSMSYQFVRGNNYKFYYVCNIGDITGNQSVTTESGLDAYQYHISDYSEIINSDGAVPMSGQSGSVTVEDGLNIFIDLTRCVALISILIDDTELEKARISINSMKIRNTPSKVMLFQDSRAASGDDCFFEGGMADNREIMMLNNGDTIHFYMFENDQGILLPGNTSDSFKFFEENSPEEDKCSYIELAGDYITDAGMILYGSFTYRFYLGGNTTSDFSIMRNVHYVISIHLTDSGALGYDWRIDSLLHYLNASDFHIYPPEHTLYGIKGTVELIAYSSPPVSLPAGLIWTSSDPSVATVDNDGCVTSTGYGTAVITASLDGISRYCASCTITVLPETPVTPPGPSPVAEVFIGQSEYTVPVNDTIHVETFLRREDGTVEPVQCRLKYDVASHGAGYFTSPENNVIQGEGPGDATMYFTYEGFRSQSVTVHIIQPI